MAIPKDVALIRERFAKGLPPPTPYELGNVVEVVKIGEGTVYICDDCCRDKTPEEVDEILKRIATNALRAIRAAAAKEQAQEDNPA